MGDDKNVAETIINDRVNYTTKFTHSQNLVDKYKADIVNSKDIYDEYAINNYLHRKFGNLNMTLDKFILMQVVFKYIKEKEDSAGNKYRRDFRDYMLYFNEIEGGADGVHDRVALKVIENMELVRKIKRIVEIGVSDRDDVEL